MNLKLLLLFLVAAFCAKAQDKITFGQLTEQEKSFQRFEKDTAAAAVYLHEYGDNYFEVRDNYVWLITNYHARIKILKPTGFKYATIKIPYYHNERRTEKVQKIKAISHTDGNRRYVKAENIYTIDKSERRSEKTFTFPNVKVGSVLEYSYEIQSPFDYNLSGWEFQADIPKVYTEYRAKIPGNWYYNRALRGYLPLDVNEAIIQQNCFKLPERQEAADCESLLYIMKDVPAFYDSEAFMLAGSNYRSRLEFELSEYTSFNGQKRKFTKSWKDVDKEFRSDKDIGRQLKKKNFFESNIPQELLTDGDPLTRAKNIYAFVRQHFMWNEKYGLWRDNRVKKAFEEKKGSVAEINITLINLLNSAGIDADMMLLATRQYALPKRENPVMTDFNYVVAKANIDGKDYLLDASDKMMPFGMLPFRCLNHYGRVMDFEDESYWFDITPEDKNKSVIRGKMAFYPEEGIAKGSLVFIKMGYPCVTKRKLLGKTNREEYIEALEQDFGDAFYISSYDLDTEYSNEKRLKETLTFEIEDILQSGELYLNPFLVKFYSKNPFSALERHYPIDFGHNRRSVYSISITIPEGYHVKALPESKNFALPENSGSLRFECKKQTENIVNVFFDFHLSRTLYNAEAYDLIKAFFQHAVDVQTKSYIVLEKVKT